MSDNNLTEQKTKYYNQVVKEAQKRYRQKRTEAYLECRKRANRNYYLKRKELADKYKELLSSGVLEKLQNIEVN